jgi:hypothetical protein
MPGTGSVRNWLMSGRAGHERSCPDRKKLVAPVWLVGVRGGATRSDQRAKTGARPAGQAVYRTFTGCRFTVWRWRISFAVMLTGLFTFLMRTIDLYSRQPKTDHRRGEKIGFRGDENPSGLIEDP